MKNLYFQSQGNINIKARKMIKSVVIDDEQQGRSIIKQYIARFCPDIEVCGEADSVKSGVAVINEKHPNIVFLDIQMQDGTGFNLLEQIPDRSSFKVIFVTSFDQFAIKAIKYSASDYLLKPLDPDAFIEAIDKVKSDIEANNKTKDNRIDELLTNINSFKKIGLPVSNAIVFVNVDDIIRCESDSSYTMFHLVDGRHLLVSKNLKVYEDLFADRKFLRVHKSHLINARYVDQYINGDGGSVVMSDGSTVEVSRRKKDELLAIMQMQ